MAVGSGSVNITRPALSSRDIALKLSIARQRPPLIESKDFQHPRRPRRATPSRGSRSGSRWRLSLGACCAVGEVQVGRAGGVGGRPRRRRITAADPSLVVRRPEPALRRENERGCNPLRCLGIGRTGAKSARRDGPAVRALEGLHGESGSGPRASADCWAAAPTAASVHSVMPPTIDGLADSAVDVLDEQAASADVAIAATVIHL